MNNFIGMTGQLIPGTYYLSKMDNISLWIRLKLAKGE